MPGHWVPPPVIGRTPFGRSPAMAGEDYKDSGLSTRAIAAAVIQFPRMLRQSGVIKVSDYLNIVTDISLQKRICSLMALHSQRTTMYETKTHLPKGLYMLNLLKFSLKKPRIVCFHFHFHFSLMPSCTK
ncbi:hypothetical protein AVEN_45996-1 [Araneus ventricosus]|uniref:Uncharacterized protein n=1 Tax=Araneus ventricosus TaxID=182803 RepID=A0A4Y2FA81_ARAVE|nr:hypothetical protein AVEN_45996-1 [Araneus ventricosus]